MPSPSTKHTECTTHVVYHVNCRRERHPCDEVPSVDALTDFLNDPLVIPIISLMVVSGMNFLLAIYRSLQNGTFEWHELPRILDTLVLRKVVPLMVLGAAAFFVTESAAGAAMIAAYVTASMAALAAEVANLIKLVTSPDGGPNPGEG